jgi:hypothetical protein
LLGSCRRVEVRNALYRFFTLLHLGAALLQYVLAFVRAYVNNNGPIRRTSKPRDVFTFAFRLHAFWGDPVAGFPATPNGMGAELRAKFKETAVSICLHLLYVGIALAAVVNPRALCVVLLFGLDKFESGAIVIRTLRKSLGQLLAALYLLVIIVLVFAEVAFMNHTAYANRRPVLRCTWWCVCTRHCATCAEGSWLHCFVWVTC